MFEAPLPDSVVATLRSSETAALAASMQPYGLSKAQARELAGYLNQAAQ